MAPVTGGETEAQRGTSGNTKVFGLIGALLLFPTEGPTLSLPRGTPTLSAKTLLQCHLEWGPSTRPTGKPPSSWGSLGTQHVSLNNLAIYCEVMTTIKLITQLSPHTVTVPCLSGALSVYFPFQDSLKRKFR